MKRREFLYSITAAAGAMAVVKGECGEAAKAKTAAHANWKGFNLLEKFTVGRNRPFAERDFEWMAGWGFDFVRLPTDYRCWTDAKDPKKLDEKILKEIDQAVEWGKQYKVHINLNLHRAPGYCVNPPAEPLNLWESPEALEQFCFQWRHFSERYKGISPEQVSFNLVNEPGNITVESYGRVVRETVKVIRAVDPNRLILIDGLKWGRDPVISLADLNVARSTHNYDPMRLTHYKASWVSGSDKWPEPTWPLKENDRVWDKERLREEMVKPWKEIEAKGAFVHVGEWGAFNQTPHAVVLAWMTDLLALWKETGWGWALWNLRGSFGVVDSGRKDVAYEDFQGRKLDRKMLELLRSGGEGGKPGGK